MSILTIILPITKTIVAILLLVTYCTTVVCRSLLYAACSPNPCQNGGTCADVDVDGTPECTCADGFSGDICETGKISYDMRVEQLTKSIERFYYRLTLSCRPYKYEIHRYHFLQDATPVMDLLLVMLLRKVHAQMLTKYARLMALVKVRVIASMNSKIAYNIITIILTVLL